MFLLCVEFLTILASPLTILAAQSFAFLFFLLTLLMSLCSAALQVVIDFAQSVAALVGADVVCEGIYVLVCVLLLFAQTLVDISVLFTAQPLYLTVWSGALPYLFALFHADMTLCSTYAIFFLLTLSGYVMLK